MITFDIKDFLYLKPINILIGRDDILNEGSYPSEFKVVDHITNEERHFKFREDLKSPDYPDLFLGKAYQCTDQDFEKLHVCITSTENQIPPPFVTY